MALSRSESLKNATKNISSDDNPERIGIRK